MAFHQNGAALSLFARDYTFSAVHKFTYIFFDVIGLHAVLAVILGAAVALNRKTSGKTKGIGSFFVLIGSAGNNL